MNNDAVAEPGLVGKLLLTANSPSQPALVSPMILWDGVEFCTYWYQPYLGHVSRRPFPGSLTYLSGCCLLADRVLLNEGRLFDERFFMYGEDIALTEHARSMAREIACAGDARVIHEGSATAKVGSDFYEYHVAYGHIILGFILSDGYVQTLFNTIGRCFYLSLRALMRTLRARSLSPALALVRAWRDVVSSRAWSRS